MTFPSEIDYPAYTYFCNMDTTFDLHHIVQHSKTITLEPPNFSTSSSTLFSSSSLSHLGFSSSPHSSRRKGPRRSGSTFYQTPSHQDPEPLLCFNSISDPSPLASYPSPPSPHPYLHPNHLCAPPLQRARSQPCYQVPGLFGILDSPLVMRPEDYPFAHEKPLSPPLTAPLSTLSLPETSKHHGDDHDFDSESDEAQEDCEIMCADDDGSTSDAQPGTRKDTLSHDGEPTLGDLLRAEGTRLSPLSPAWHSEMAPASEDSALLGAAPSAPSTLAHRRSRGSLVTDRGQPYRRSRAEPYSTPSPTWSPVRGAAGAVLVGHEGDAHAPECCDDEPCPRRDPASYMPSPRLTPPRELSAAETSEAEGSMQEPFTSPFAPWGTDLSLDVLESSEPWAAGPSSSADFGFQQPFHLFPGISESYRAQDDQDSSLFPLPLFDEDYSMEDDSHPDNHSPISPTSVPPFQFPIPDTPASAPTHADPLPPPCSPSISKLCLPDLSDDEDHPSSPSRRSFSSLPELDMEDLDIHGFSDPAPFPHPSPGPTLLSLPGAEADEDLLPAPLPNFTTSPPPTHTTCASPSLLFIDDPQDVPLPRSPSPEDFDLRIVLDDDSDPELAKLYNLRKKSLAAERAARHAEAQLIEAGSVCLRAEATKEKRKNKERSKELGALLRIKLGDKVLPEDRPRSTSPGGISGISQLVARMLFKRHETFRPLTHRKAGASDKGYVRSSLSRSVPAFSRSDFA